MPSIFGLGVDAPRNAVAFFIILVAAVTLHAHGSTDIETADQAVEVPRPMAG